MNLIAAFSDKITRFVSDGYGVEVIYLTFRNVFDIVFREDVTDWVVWTNRWLKKPGWILRLRR